MSLSYPTLPDKSFATVGLYRWNVCASRRAYELLHGQCCVALDDRHASSRSGDYTRFPPVAAGPSPAAMGHNEPMCAFETHGFAIVPDVVSKSHCEALASAIRQDLDSAACGSRTWLSRPWCQQLAESLRANSCFDAMGVRSLVAVQCTLFDKSPLNNWLVSLHQDLSIPVKERVSDPSLSGWSTKDDLLFVQPPITVLQSSAALRFHLDDCGPDAGALRVVPGSHQFGRLDVERASALREEHGEITASVGRGGVLVMRPLLLHASSKATVPSSRRVLHFVFGPRSLPSGLRWAQVV